jgi:hypothetical protein
MGIPRELKDYTDAFFLANSDEFDLSTKEGCGKYIEALVIDAQNKGWDKVGHLRKRPDQTHYRGHAVDAILWNEPINGLLQAIDVIINAEAKPPYGSGNEEPSAGFGIDIPRYRTSDWLKSPMIGRTVATVPWVPYNENGFDRLKEQLKYDYGRRPQDADFDVTVWSARVFHSAYMGPEGIPLGLEEAMLKHRLEWCDALGISVDGVWF